MDSSDIVDGYKIIEIENGLAMSLYHGTHNSRKIKLDEWYRGHDKWVRDGSGGVRYRSGWHFFDTFIEAVRYMRKMIGYKKRFIVKCKGRGNVRTKWSGACLLCDEIYISSMDLEKAVDPSIDELEFQGGDT